MASACNQCLHNNQNQPAQFWNQLRNLMPGSLICRDMPLLHSGSKGWNNRTWTGGVMR